MYKAIAVDVDGTINIQRTVDIPSFVLAIKFIEERLL
jgi:hydroxymethylpyrimidine pyrophosphatase-like HAD family hydrolase